jgi:hypothetical protein
MTVMKPRKFETLLGDLLNTFGKFTQSIEQTKRQTEEASPSASSKQVDSQRYHPLKRPSRS